MELKIIDGKSTQGTECVIVHFVGEGIDRCFDTEYFSSPATPHIKDLIRKYFLDYSTNVHTEPLADIPERLIRLGKAIGDGLLGEDHELYGVKDAIEKIGYENLSVIIESSCPTFFQEQWELLILPDSAFVLSSVVQRFSKKFHNDLHHSSAAIHYELNETESLNILKCISRPALNIRYCQLSNFFRSSFDLLSFDGAIECKFGTYTSIAEFEKYLEGSTTHIFDYDGPVVFEDNEGYLYLNGDNAEPVRINVRDFARLAVKKNIGLVIVNVCIYINGNEELDANLGLAMIAKSLMAEGVPCVVGLNNLTDIWTATKIFNSIYRCIGKGFDVSQAVVEARKLLQKDTESLSFSTQIIDAQCWSLPSVFAQNKVVFYAMPRLEKEIFSTERYSLFRQKLHGFKSQYIPPHINEGSDGALLHLINNNLQGKVVSICGDSGSGKTYHCHILAAHLVSSGVENAYYFNFQEYLYTTDNILTMIGESLSLDVKATKEFLNNSKHLFIFDDYLNINMIQDVNFQEKLILLNEFIDVYSASNTFVLTGYAGSLNVMRTNEVIVNLKPLEVIEVKRLAVDVLKKKNILGKDNSRQYFELLNSFKGNPFLTVNASPLIDFDTPEDLVAQIEQVWLQANNSSCLVNPPCLVNSYHDWRWSHLSKESQHLCILLADFPDIYLEIFASVFDGKDKLQAAIDLMQLLSDSNESVNCSYAENISEISKAGFTTSYPYGTVMNSQFKSYLKAKGEQKEFFEKNTDKLKRLLSIIICEAISKLIKYLHKQPNQIITQNILINRNFLARNMEVLWELGEWQAFINVLMSMEQYLSVNNLAEELYQWSDVLLAKNTSFLSISELSEESMISWLHVASSALKSSEIKSLHALKTLESQWSNWFFSLDSAVVANKSSVYGSCFTFLNYFYRKFEDWQSLINVNEAALIEFKAHNVWPLVVKCLNTLLDVNTQLAHKERSIVLEQELLSLVAGEKFNFVTKNQIIVQMIERRLLVGDADRAQELLHCALELIGANEKDSRYNLLQAEIYTQQNMFPRALEIFQKLLAEQKDSAVGNSQAVEYFEKKISELKNKLVMSDSRMSEKDMDITFLAESNR